jgi:branched-chain amino acid transport system substrate-binding protein
MANTTRRAVLSGMLGAPLVLSPRAFAQGGKQPIRVGSTLALTGPLSQTASIHKIAAEIAVDHINRNGGLLGRPVEHVLYDDQSQPGVTRTLYEKLITVDKVDLVLGPYATAGILAAMTVAQRYGKVMVQPSLGIPNLSTYDMMFGSSPLSSDPGTYVVTLVFDAVSSSGPPPKSIAIMTSKFPSSQFYAKTAQALAEKRGVRTALYLEYEFGTRDFGAIASRVKDADADLVYGGMLGVEPIQFLTAAKSLGYVPKQHFYFAPSLGQLAESAEAANALSIAYIDEDLPYTNYRGVKDFIKDFDERAAKANLPYPHVETQCATQYAAWQILAAGVEGSKSLDDKAIADWLKKNEVDDLFGRVNFKGAYNTTTNDLSKIGQLQNKKWVTVWPKEFATPGYSIKVPS